VTDRSRVEVFRPEVPEGFEWVRLDRDEDYRVLLDLDARPALPGWTPLAAHLLTRDDGTGRERRRAELPWLGRQALVLRDDAIDALGPLLEPFGELLPLACPDARLAIVHLTNVLDALDEERSELVRFGSGRIMTITRYELLADRLAAPQAFKLPQMPGGAMLLTGDLVERIEAAGFAGTAFQLVWEGPAPT
jgi:hypothetical protein